MHPSDVDYLTPPNHCEGCGSWAHYHEQNYDLIQFYRFYSELSSIDDNAPNRTWVLELVYLCQDCVAKGLCHVTKYKLSHWLNDQQSHDFFVEFFDQEAHNHYESFYRTKANNWTCKFQFSYAVDNDNVKDKMHHIAAYIIQHAFRCGWDYRRAFED